MQKKRTFGDLVEGSYFWRATAGSIHRVAVKFIHHIDADRISISYSYYCPAESVNKAARAIENDPPRIYWYIDKKDAQRKAIELQKKEIKDMELQLSIMYRELKESQKKWLLEDEDAGCGSIG